MISLLAATLAVLPACLAAPRPQAAPVSSCSPLELIIARGTMEPGMPYGVIVGDPLLRETKKLIPEATAYAVDYPASIAPNSKSLGAADVIKHITEQAAKCPNQKYVLSGYSQGGDVQHDATQKIPKELFPRIIALVMFGDPGNKGPTARSPQGDLVPVFPPELQQKTKQNCANGDPVCSSGANILKHLEYSQFNYMPSSAAYIKKQFESGGTSGPEAAVL